MVMPDDQTKSNRSKLNEALELLNEAAREKKGELQNILTDKYSHIREAMTLEAQKAKSMAQEVMVDGEKKIKEATAKVDANVRKDPWPYVAGTAAIALLVGYLMGSKRK